MTEPKKVRHHYVPRFYLNGFTTGDPPMLWIYDKEASGKRRQAGTGDAALEKHYYSIIRDDGTRDSTTIEDAFAEFEDDSAPVLRAIRAGEQLSAADRTRLASFMAVLMARVPLARLQTAEIVRTISESAARPILKAQFEGPAEQQWASTKRLLEELKAAGLPPLRHVIVEPRPEVTLSGVIIIMPRKWRGSSVTCHGPLSPRPDATPS